MTARLHLELRDNNLAGRAVCPLCGHGHKPDIGPWPFVAATWQSVCDQCFIATAPPELVQAWESQRAAFLKEFEASHSNLGIWL